MQSTRSRSRRHRQADRRAAATLVLGDRLGRRGSAASWESEEAKPERRPRSSLASRASTASPRRSSPPSPRNSPSLVLHPRLYSLDGEFFGYPRRGRRAPRRRARTSRKNREIVGRRFDGDRFAFVREAYALPPRGILILSIVMRHTRRVAVQEIASRFLVPHGNDYRAR